MLYKPDFKNAYIKANELLVSSTLFSSFPVDIKAVIKELSDIKLITYEKALSFGINVKAFGSDDAQLVEKNGRYIIFYNSKVSKERQNFSISHEFDHYILCHKTMEILDDALKPFSQEIYEKQELETNFCTAQVLMPEQIIREFRRRGKNVNSDFLMKYFGVSRQAAEKRLETLQKVNSSRLSPEQRYFDDIILRQAKKFIDRIAPEWDFYDFEKEEAKQMERDSWY